MLTFFNFSTFLLVWLKRESNPQQLQRRWHAENIVHATNTAIIPQRASHGVIMRVKNTELPIITVKDAVSNTWKENKYVSLQKHHYVVIVPISVHKYPNFLKKNPKP